MKQYSLLQCGIDNNCLNNIIHLTTYFFNVRTEIIKKITNNTRIEPRLIEELKEKYDDFSKDFFSKKTVACLKKHCSDQLPDVLTDFQKMLNITNYYRTQIIKHSLSSYNRIYIVLLDTIIYMINDFSHNYKIKYLGKK